MLYLVQFSMTVRSKDDSPLLNCMWYTHTRTHIHIAVGICIEKEDRMEGERVIEEVVWSCSVLHCGASH